MNKLQNFMIFGTYKPQRATKWDDANFVTLCRLLFASSLGDKGREMGLSSKLRDWSIQACGSKMKMIQWWIEMKSGLELLGVRGLNPLSSVHVYRRSFLS